MRFMTLPILRARRWAEHGSRTLMENVMKWETPQAIELRFGMEITMYVANR